jgi:hypothetical protein
VTTVADLDLEDFAASHVAERLPLIILRARGAWQGEAGELAPSLVSRFSLPMKHSS